MPGLRPKRRSIRPESIPVSISPTGMDFEKRQLLITQVSGSTIKSIMPAISDAVVTYEDVAVSHNDDVVYQL